MKIIITEEQYKELTKVDDVFDNLSPYFRRRIKIVDIMDTIDSKIDWVLKSVDVHLLPSDKGLERLVKDVIDRVIWTTEWTEVNWDIDDDKLVEYEDLMMGRILEKYGNYIKKNIIKKLKN